MVEKSTSNEGTKSTPIKVIEDSQIIKPSTTSHPIYTDIVNACKSVFDPEIPVNVYDLGLIYTIEISEEGNTHILMTLTAPGCPVAGEMP